MYRNTYQRGLFTVFFSCGSKPLDLWDVHIKNGYVSRFLDQEIKSMVVEIGGTNVSTTYIMCPKGKQVLGISMPYLVMIIKNLNKYFTFEVTVLDETGTRRRFRVSNFQSSTQILPLCTVIPIGLADGWNQVQFNLPDFMQRAYKKQFVEVQKLKINANIRLRRIYFTERLLSEAELPPDYKLYFPMGRTSARDKKPIQKEKLVEKEEKPDDVKDIKQPAIMTSVTTVHSKPLLVKSMSHTSIGKKKSEEQPHVKQTISLQKVTEEGEMGIATQGGEIKSEAKLEAHSGEILEKDDEMDSKPSKTENIVPDSSKVIINDSEALTHDVDDDANITTDLDATQPPDAIGIEDTKNLVSTEKLKSTEHHESTEDPEAAVDPETAEDVEATQHNDAPEDSEAIKHLAFNENIDESGEPEENIAQDEQDN